MGIIATVKVITKINRAGQPKTTQLGNWEQVTIIKYINIMGGTILPLVIFKAVIYQATWYKDNIILYNQLISISENGQTTNKISLIWLNLFYKYIKTCTISTH